MPAPLQPRSRWKRILLGCAVIALLVAFGAFRVFQVAFDESLDTPRYSLDYFLAIDSKVIRGFPVEDDAKQLLFHSSCGDGPKAPSEGLSFLTSVKPELVLAGMDHYLRDSGYSDRPDGVGYQKPGSKLFLKLSTENGLTKVVVHEMY